MYSQRSRMTNKNQFKDPFKLPEKATKQVFSVPDDYFDKLPTIIQSKAIDSTKKTSVFHTNLWFKLALPVLLVLVVVSYWGFKYQTSTSDAQIEAMLADISTEEMVNYLDQTDLSSEDLLELVSFEGEQIDDFSVDLENISDEDLELLMDDFNIEELENI